MGKLQDHIHLGTTLSGAPEFAPLYTWSVYERTQSYMTFSSLEYSLTGRAHHFILKDGGNPIIKRNFEYVIAVKEEFGLDTEARLDLLLSLLGREVFLVDSHHVDNGLDHTPNIRTMFFDQIGNPAPVNTGNVRYYVQISLKEK